MSQQEFDSYLALLCRLLRIAPQQREQVAEEFRAHMEDRLEELLAAGLSREEAIQQAIGEFGDAAGLAAQLLKIQQGRRKRWIVRISAASVLCLILAGLLTLTLLPEHQQVPVIAQAQAQQKSEKSAATAADTPDSRIDKALAANVDLEFHDQPLIDIVPAIERLTKIPVILQRKKLEEAAINLETPVNFSIKGISLKSALRLMLEELGLDYVAENEVIQITTPEDTGSKLEIRIYDCRSLSELPDRKRAAAKEVVPPPPQSPAPQNPVPSGPPGSRMKTRGYDLSDNLVELITDTVCVDTWDDVGGPGSIREYKGMIIASQTARVHEEIERLLNLMHSAGGLEGKVKVSH